VRWDHSELTTRIPTTGRSTTTGAVATESISRSVWSSASPAKPRITTAATASPTVLSSSQKPARVSLILRSSTAVSQVRLGRAMGAAIVVVLIGWPP
jgi:hypothetical protein